MFLNQAECKMICQWRRAGRADSPGGRAAARAMALEPFTECQTNPPIGRARRPLARPLSA
eukprot:748441-Hanusia_phi.AAC.1